MLCKVKSSLPESFLPGHPPLQGLSGPSLCAGLRHKIQALLAALLTGNQCADATLCKITLSALAIKARSPLQGSAESEPASGTKLRHCSQHCSQESTLFRLPHRTASPEAYLRRHMDLVLHKESSARHPLHQHAGQQADPPGLDHKSFVYR